VICSCYEQNRFRFRRSVECVVYHFEPEEHGSVTFASISRIQLGCALQVQVNQFPALHIRDAVDLLLGRIIATPQRLHLQSSRTTHAEPARSTPTLQVKADHKHASSRVHRVTDSTLFPSQATASSRRCTQATNINHPRHSQSANRSKQIIAAGSLYARISLSSKMQASLSLLWACRDTDSGPPVR
jgi:hypothetical protein